MDPAIQAKFKPPEPPRGRDFSDQAVKDAGPAQDGNPANRVNFRDLLLNSNDDVARQRVAQKNGDQLRAAKSDADFAKMLTDRANQGNLRKPQNELDKDAFLKLFVTQMRNQDPLNPDNSAQMAAQLAQFHGLEQMMNVNKNLEKMQTEAAVGRAVGLIGFVGKDVHLDNGKLFVSKGKVATDAVMKLAGPANQVSLELRDGSGSVVATKALGPMNAGEHKVEWEGKGKDGKPLLDGAYTFSVMATDMRGQAVAAPITSTVKITGVDLKDPGGAFYTPLGKIGVTEVAAVGDNLPGDKAEAKVKEPSALPATPTSAANGAEVTDVAKAPSPEMMQLLQGEAGAHAPERTAPPAAPQPTPPTVADLRSLTNRGPSPAALAAASPGAERNP